MGRVSVQRHLPSLRPVETPTGSEVSCECCEGCNKGNHPVAKDPRSSEATSYPIDLSWPSLLPFCGHPVCR